MEISRHGSSDSFLFAVWSLVAAVLKGRRTNVAPCLRGETWSGLCDVSLLSVSRDCLNSSHPLCLHTVVPTEATHREEGVPCLPTWSFFLRGWSRVTAGGDWGLPLLYVQWTAFFFLEGTHGVACVMWKGQPFGHVLTARGIGEWTKLTWVFYWLIDDWVGTQIAEIWARFIWQ